MKTILSVVLAMMCVAGARAQEMVSVSAPQVKDDLFAGTDKFAKNAKDVTELNMDPTQMAMAGNYNPAAKKMFFMIVHTYTYDQPGMYNVADVDVYRKKLQDGTWNCFIHIVDSKKSESTDLCSKQSADGQTNDLVIMSVEAKGLTFIHMKGNMSLNDLKNAANTSAHSITRGGVYSPAPLFVPRTVVIPLQDEQRARMAAEQARMAAELDKQRRAMSPVPPAAPVAPVPPTQ